MRLRLLKHTENMPGCMISQQAGKTSEFLPKRATSADLGQSYILLIGLLDASSFLAKEMSDARSPSAATPTTQNSPLVQNSSFGEYSCGLLSLSSSKRDPK